MRATPAFWRTHALWPALAFASAFVCIFEFDLDRTLAHAWFFDAASQRWLGMGAGAWWAHDLIHTGGRWLVRLVAALALAAWVLSLFFDRWRHWRRDAGFVAGAIPGRMVLPSAGNGAPPVLVLSFDTQAALAEDPAQSAVREVTLSLDVPQVPRSEQPFVRMRDAAIALAASMDGLITDDNGQVIRVEALDVIGASLEQLYDTLETRDVSAGSPQARRAHSCI